MSKEVKPAEKVKYAAETVAKETVYPVLISLAVFHMMNDAFQSLITGMYPLLKESYNLTFTQVGIITLVYRFLASILQPIVGWLTDRKHQKYALTVAMTSTAIGLFSFGLAQSYGMLLVSVAFIGLGSSVFHPESSRVAHFASGGQKGLAQSIFQVGGRVGASMGPLLAAFIILPLGQLSVVWFGAVALLGAFLLTFIGRWYRNRQPSVSTSDENKSMLSQGISISSFSIPRDKAIKALTILMVLTLSKYIYLACMRSYLTFYMIQEFGVSTQTSQIILFVFLFSAAAGTYFGGPIGDRIGRKYVIWISILGAAPLALLFPYVGFWGAMVLSVLIGAILSSAFPAILVYAQDLMPTSLGMISGLFYGFAFGVGGVASVLVGKLADATSIQYAFYFCSYFPLVGIIAYFLPNLTDK